MIRSMMALVIVPKDFWGYAVVTAALIGNRDTFQFLSKFTTLFHVWFAWKPDLMPLRVLGSICCSHDYKEGAKKLEGRRTPAVLIGYSQNQETYKLWDPKYQNALRFRDVRFDEMTDCINAFTKSASLNASGRSSATSMP